MVSGLVAPGVPLGPSVLGDELGAAQWRRLLGLRASLARSKVAEVPKKVGLFGHFFQGKGGRQSMTP